MCIKIEKEMSVNKMAFSGQQRNDMRKQYSLSDIDETDKTKTHPSQPPRPSTQNSGKRPSQPTPSASTPVITKKPLPVDFVDEAERVMRNPALSEPDFKDKDSQKRRFKITTSKIRNFLSLVSEIYNTENTRTDNLLDEKSMKKIQMMRIRVLYDAGRDETEAVMKFVKVSNILNYIQDIGGDRQKFIDFAHYVEALVAYHRFLGGKEN
jgi:CRISPR-associated protein Csm2